MSYKGELQTFTKLSMRHKVCRGETCRTTISESTKTCSCPGAEVIVELHIMHLAHN